MVTTLREYMDRKEAAEYLTELGLRTTVNALNKLAHRKIGPRYHIYGTRSVYTRDDLERVRAVGETLHIHVLGLASIAMDVTPDLARAAVASVSVLGALHASAAVKAALADRMV